MCCLYGGSPCPACVVAVCCLCGGSLCDICTGSSCAASLEPVMVPACVLDSPGAVWFGSGCAVHVCAVNVPTDNLCTVMNVDSQGTM